MSNLISRSALIEAITDVEVAWDMDGNYTTYDSTTIVDIINEQPTVEVKPVVHGEWMVQLGLLYPEFVCSECRKIQEKKSIFCPNCGADMRKKVQHG